MTIIERRPLTRDYRIEEENGHVTFITEERVAELMLRQKYQQ